MALYFVLNIKTNRQAFGSALFQSEVMA